MSSQQVVAKNSIESAVSQGMISANVAADILDRLDDIASSGASGVDVDSIDSEEATLVVPIIDASGSMDKFQNVVISAYNEHFLAPLCGAKNADSIYVSPWVFSAPLNSVPDEYCRLIHGYKPVKDAAKLDMSAYGPDGGTPLWMAVHRGLTGLVSYGQTLRDAGTSTKCIAIVFSDGEENQSGRNFTKTMVSNLSKNLLDQEIYVLSYVYFGSGSDAQNEAESAKYAAEIGFPDRHRLTTSLSDSQIRRLFGVVSASVISASQNKVSAGSLSSNAFFTSP